MICIRIKGIKFACVKTDTLCSVPCTTRAYLHLYSEYYFVTAGYFAVYRTTFVLYYSCTVGVACLPTSQAGGQHPDQPQKNILVAVVTSSTTKVQPSQFFFVITLCLRVCCCCVVDLLTQVSGAVSGRFSFRYRSSLLSCSVNVSH